ncbi:MAG: 2-oxoacid:ferredoxin oxidoreductase subunit beta [Deltaproteobacteria bacterium]|nr:2-oxoacid:ferredoxin oxidoreductase subunit beta [Deltaproteobacteria bacterium]MCB9788846.1 2-oxoacid:ferredoxin oxidoreductase subunit beta [Deltaproteobacteria bacterium]
MSVAEPTPKLTRKDFTSDQEVRWCPGCGDYAILAAVQRLMPDLGVPKEDVVFVSGIGCAARFPYYMNTYGFHTIHGRAPAVATGIKLANPKLDIWLVSGDGDALSIGGNHLIHLLRRNVDLQMLLFNNQIYGLTKGQYSPTSVLGQRTPSSPMGSVDPAASAAELALGAGAHFVARSVDTDLKHLPTVLTRAHQHRGTSLVEIFQNCVVFNDNAFGHFTARDVASERQLLLEHGKPLLFGAARDKGLRVRPGGGFQLEVVQLGEDGIGIDDVMVHDETDRVLAGALAQLQPPAFPVALGVLYCNPAVTTYERAVRDQVRQARAERGAGNLNALIRSGHTWKVE